MRLKSGLWVAAYLRRCSIAGAYGVVRRRGAEEAGVVFIRISRLDGSSDLLVPHRKLHLTIVRPIGPSLRARRAACPRCRHRDLSGARNQIRPGCLDRRDRGSCRPEFSRRHRRLKPLASRRAAAVRNRLRDGGPAALRRRCARVFAHGRSRAAIGARPVARSVGCGDCHIATMCSLLPADSS